MKYIVIAIFFLIVLASLGWYIDSNLHDNVLWTIQAGLYIVIASLALALGGSAVLFVLLFREKLLRQKALRRQAEKEADTHIVVSDTHGVFVREMNPRATWRPLHLNPATYQNGKQAEISPDEFTAWQTWQALRAPRVAHNTPQQALLPATTEAEQLDLLTVFTQPTQSYAIIGGQQTGKTFQARHIANYWLRQGIKPAVIGPKWDKGEWVGCHLMGGSGDFEKVEWGIGMIRKLAEGRHADSTRGHKEHPIQPIFFDDWTPIVDAVPSARALILESTTLYASVNIILYFILHSDTANAWGVDRKGAALKDNFIKLYIVPQYDGQGQVVRHLTRGYIRFAGESVDRPVKLISTLPAQRENGIEIRLNGSPGFTQEIPQRVNEAEAQIIELHQQGASYNEIARQVWGSTGGNQTKAIKEILAKFEGV